MTPAEAARYIPRVRTLLARDGYSEQEIQDALQAVPATIDPMPISRRTGKPTQDKQGAERLYDRCCRYLDCKSRDAGPRRNGFTESEWDDVMRAVRHDCSRRVRGNLAHAAEIAEAHEWLNLEALWRERDEAKQRTIDSLLAYIASLPLPETVLTMDRRAA